MVELIRTDSEHSDFRELVTLLDADLRVRDGDDHAFFAQFNKIDSIRHVVVASYHAHAAGCGAIKHFDNGIMEVKRMFVHPDFRRLGIATAVLRELENWSRELGYKKCILETGIRQPEAIGLYQRNGYSVIPNYGQYENVKTSVCFEKNLNTE